MCSSSRALSKSASGVVVTSTLCRRRPAAIAGSQCSSRWKRIVRAIALPCLKNFFEPGRSRLGFHFFDEPTLFLDFRLDVVAVVVVVG